MSEEEYRNEPEVLNYPEWQKAFYYILYVGNCADYDEGMAYIAEKLRNPEELSQAATCQALGILVRRFYNIKEDLILPLLFENLKSNNKRVYGETLDLFDDIIGRVPRLTRRIYLAYFENGIDFFTGKKLKIFTDKNLIHSLNNEEEKIEFILSFCQNSKNYQEALEICLYFLKKNESIKINTAAVVGLTYIIARFQKIKLKAILPFITKHLKHSSIGSDLWWDARSLLGNIVIMIPKLRIKIIPLLKKYYSVQLKTPSVIEYIMTKNKKKDQIKLEKMLKLYVNNLKREKIKYNLPDF
ncbi:hypothetical protein [Rickettsia endosymbiont of Orchestes rusci]|uniref:hypothetical protein n=1 Tax=Rickettsia endosymbiont of Orchestes rusci TaxID=3066250 RepID=UPI00313CA212